MLVSNRVITINPKTLAKLLKAGVLPNIDKINNKIMKIRNAKTACDLLGSNLGKISDEILYTS